MLLQEFLFKLSFFFIIGFLFGLAQNFFLKLTENSNHKQRFYNISHYFPLSYGIFLPILAWFLGSVYFPIGMSRYSQNSHHFEVDHSTARIFAYLLLLFLFFVMIGINAYLTLNYSLDIFTLILLMWFLQVLLVFLIFNLLPVYPMLLGSLLLKELKVYFIQKNKIENLVYLNFLIKLGIFLLFFIILSLNFDFLNYKITLILEILSNVKVSYLTIILAIILFFMIYLIYTKKRAYNQYLKYIKEILTQSFLQEQNHKR